MEKEDRVVLIHISETLDKILIVLAKPPNKLAKIFEMAATIVTLLGILGAVDVIRGWIGG